VGSIPERAPKDKKAERYGALKRLKLGAGQNKNEDAIMMPLGGTISLGGSLLFVRRYKIKSLKFQ
jgi:hypothetical protein